MKRRSHKIGKGDMERYLSDHEHRDWELRAGYFEVTDDWYPPYSIPTLPERYMRASLRASYEGMHEVYVSGADDHNHTYHFASLLEAETFWDLLVAEGPLESLMIDLIYEPFYPW